MATYKKENVTVTSTTFSVRIINIIAGEVLRFFLYYDAGTGNPGTAITTGEEFGPSTTTGDHTFLASGLTPDSKLIFTVICKPVGATNWDNATDVVRKEPARTLPAAPAKTWPGDWTKWKNLKKGNDVTLVTADDWNDFLDRINEVIDYKGGTQFNFSRYKKSEGDDMIASDFNSGAISAMRSIGLSPTQAVKDGDITADFFIGLENTLNSAK